MLYIDMELEAEVYTFRNLSGKIFVEGMIKGYGFVLYGSTYSFVPVLTDMRPDENMLREMVDLLVRELVNQFYPQVA